MLGAILGNIKGRKRRRMIRDYCAAGKLDELYDDLLNNIPNEETRKLLPQIRPTFMGKRKEVDIVTIDLVWTVNGDTIVLRARWSGGRIKYQIIDGYEEVYEYEDIYNLPQNTSLRPFSLRELIVFLDSVKLREADSKWQRFGFPLLYNERILEDDANLENLDNLRDFTRVSSDFLS